MKLSVLANLYGSKSLDETLSILSGLGVHTAEIGAGGYPGKAHCNPAELLADAKKYDEFVATFKKYDVEICALAAHGNPLHPNKEIAAQYDEDFRNAVLLAEKLGVDTVITFSGCPGDHEGAKLPNWVTCAWPDDYIEILNWQWEEKVIPYWKDMGAFCKAHGVRIAFEMHPGFCVYNPETLLRLREAVGTTIGANLDPSHLFWQGMNIIDVINTLGDAIYYFHAKDTLLNEHNVRKNGVLDTKPYSDLKGRSWVFRTMGYGNDAAYWKKIISQLLVVGYDDSISIEHEDSLMSPKEGLEKAIAFLADKIVTEKPGGAWWF